MATRKPNGECGPSIWEELPIPDRTRQTIRETPIPSSVNLRWTSLVGTIYKVKEVLQLNILVASTDILTRVCVATSGGWEHWPY